jgi:hypothetical protein
MKNIVIFGFKITNEKARKGNKPREGAGSPPFYVDLGIKTYHNNKMTKVKYAAKL